LFSTLFYSTIALLLLIRIGWVIQSSLTLHGHLFTRSAAWYLLNRGTLHRKRLLPLRSTLVQKSFHFFKLHSEFSYFFFVHVSCGLWCLHFRHLE
jgi:hypothetical protein